MFEGDVYYCWSCDAHCRAVTTKNSAATCPRCRELLSADCRLDDSPANQDGPRILSFLTPLEAGKKAVPTASPGLWPTRAAAMH